MLQTIYKYMICNSMRFHARFGAFLEAADKVFLLPSPANVRLIEVCEGTSFLSLNRPREFEYSRQSYVGLGHW